MNTQEINAASKRLDWIRKYDRADAAILDGLIAMARRCIKLESKVKRKPSKPSSPLLPLTLQSPAMQKAWSDWQAHRIEIKKPLTPKSIEMQIEKFMRWGTAISIDRIERAIRNGWRGLDFADNSNGHNSTQQPMTAAEKTQRAVAETHAMIDGR